MTTTQTQIPERGTAEFRKYAAAVMASDGPWEWRNKREGDWMECHHPLWNWKDNDYRIAVPPQPVIKPWTFETAPMERLRAKRKTDGKRCVAGAYPDGVFIDYSCIPCNGECAGWVAYSDFARDFEQLDGSPCGTLEEWPKWFVSGDWVWRMDSEHEGECFIGPSRKPYASACSVETLSNDTGVHRITAAEAVELLRGKEAQP